MAHASKPFKVRIKEKKVTEFKQHSNISALQLLVKSQQGNLGVDVKELMAFQLTLVPYSLGTSDFSTKMYQKGSTKSIERERRGLEEKIISTGEATKRPKDWAAFLTND